MQANPYPDEFRRAKSLAELTGPGTGKLSPLMEALWHDSQGRWEAAHNIAQDIETPDGSELHAYLHRKEGDQGNAAYWYRRAGRPVAHDTLDEEWLRLFHRFSGS